MDKPLLVQDSLCWVSLARCFVLWRMMQIFPGMFCKNSWYFNWYLVIQWYIRRSKIIVFCMLLFLRFDELFSQVLKILPAQVENVQEMFEELSAMDRTRKKTVIFNPGQRHQELWMIAMIQWQIKLATYFLIVDKVPNWQQNLIGHFCQSVKSVGYWSTIHTYIVSHGLKVAATDSLTKDR